MGLNAQEAIFAWYQPATSRLTSAVFGKALLSVPLKALHRKYFLDLLINGWRLCRHSSRYSAKDGGDSIGEH
jgi:uncharacterized membrane protein